MSGIQTNYTAAAGVVAPAHPGSPGGPTSGTQVLGQQMDQTFGARTGSAPVVLNTGGGAPAASADKVLNYAESREGSKDGDGECWTLAENSLKAGGFKTSSDLQHITEAKDQDYKWGDKVSTDDARPGDILQFKNYKEDVKTTTTHDDGSSEWKTQDRETKHHTAIVLSNDGNGKVTVLEQNFGKDGEKVITRRQIDLKSNQDPSGTNPMREAKVQGQVSCYRPIPKDS